MDGALGNEANGLTTLTTHSPMLPEFVVGILLRCLRGRLRDVNINDAQISYMNRLLCC